MAQNATACSGNTINQNSVALIRIALQTHQLLSRLNELQQVNKQWFSTGKKIKTVYRYQNGGRMKKKMPLKGLSLISMSI